MNEVSRIRDSIVKEYTSKGQAEGCGVFGDEARRLYSESELAGVPEDAQQSFFGCGNPHAFSQIKAGDVVLDLGSGAGLDLIVASKAVGPNGKVIGVDMTEAMIERARENLRAAGVTNAEVRKGIIEELPVETGSVDWVISNCVVNLSPEKDRVFSEIHRVLKPGGQVLISDIVVNDPPHWVRSLVGKFNPSVGKSMGEEQYLATVRDQGLNDVKVLQHYTYDQASLKQMVHTDIDQLAGENPGAWRRLKTRLTHVAANRVVDAVTGKVVSIKLYAKKESN